jgi:hypothetical protein
VFPLETVMAQLQSKANDLVNAWSYASAYADEIDRAINQQDENDSLYSRSIG